MDKSKSRASLSNNDRRKSKIKKMSLLHIIDYEKTIRHLSSVAISNSSSDEINWEKFLQAITDSKKTLNTCEVIMEYFLTLKDFIDYTKDTYKSNYIEILSTMALHTEYSFLSANKVLMKVGDKGDRFYIVLKGKLAILIIKSEKMYMTEEDYFKYLYNLKVFSEEELFTKAINSTLNQSIYPIKDQKLELLNSINMNPVVSKRLSKNNLKSLKNVQRQSTQTLGKFGSYDMYNLSKYSTMPKFDSIEEYIKRLQPIKSESDNPKAKLIEVYYYFKVGALEKGRKFGEAALESDTCRRNATIMAEVDTHLAYIGREAYKAYFQDESEKIKRMCVNTLHATILFKCFPKRYFEKKYYFMFIQEKIQNGRLVLQQNSEPTELIITIEGDYEISLRSNLKKLLSILEYYGLDNQQSDLMKHIKKNYYAKFNQFLEMENNYKLFIIRNKEIFGLPSFYNVDSNKCLFNVELISSKGLIFKMDQKIYNSSVRPTTQVKEGERLKVKEQITMFIDRLIQIREVALGGFLRRYGSSKEKEKFYRNLSLSIPDVKVINKDLPDDYKLITNISNDAELSKTTYSNIKGAINTKSNNFNNFK